jgi:replicative superfamily II helicase
LSQRPVIDNLWKWRCKVLAHTDVSVIESGRQFFDEYPINGGEIEKILDSAQKIISMIKSAIAKRGESYCFDIIKDEAEKDAARVIEELGYFFTEEKKHRERYVKGEIDDIKFPPPS